MNNDELLTRSLLGAMGAVVAWLAWVLTGVASEPSGSVVTTAGLGLVATIAVFLACRALLGSTRLTDPVQLVRALTAFAGFGVVAVVSVFADAPELAVRLLSTASQMGCGLFLGFTPRAAVGGLGLAAALSAIDTPFYGTVLLAVGLTVYLERNPLALPV
ncbi:MAG: hypothetical protein KJN63_06870 [Acidimicrobiia bacterium]|nr:hypothetical protein [Acidimicrobiia bacterium]